jgi:hypothetical protein
LWKLFDEKYEKYTKQIKGTDSFETTFKVAVKKCGIKLIRWKII